MNKSIYLDIGNSNTKWKFQNSYFKIPTNRFDINKLPKSSKKWLSNVSSDFMFEEDSDIVLVKSQARYKSLKNSYTEPHLLGSDRWLAMIASYEMSSLNSFITIDIGSAVTIDVVDSFGNHQGGLICPGLKKIRQTFNFPVNYITNIHSLGVSTQEAWSIGTLSLIANFINFKVNQLKIEFPDALIFVSGGGFEKVKKFIQFTYEYHENLVLDGLEFYVDNMR